MDTLVNSGAPPGGDPLSAADRAVVEDAPVDPNDPVEHPPTMPASTHAATVSAIRQRGRSRGCRTIGRRTRVRMSGRRRPTAAGAPAPGPTGRAARGSSPQRQLAPR